MKLLTEGWKPKGLLVGEVVEFYTRPIFGESAFEKIMLEEKEAMIRRIAEVFAVPPEMLGL